MAHGRSLAARGALWLSVSSWSAKIAQTVALLVLAKALAPSQFGILAIAALTYNVLQAINELGVADALVYLQDQIEEASRTALSMVVLAGLVLMGVAWGLAPVIASFFHSPSATFVLRGFAVCLPLDAAAQVPVARLTRSLRFSRRVITDALPSVIGAAVTVVVVVSGYPLIGLVAGQIAGSAANAVVAMLVGPRCLPGWNSVMARRLLKYGGYLSAADLVNLGLLNVDYIIVGHVLGPVALGEYSLAYRICFMPYLSIAVVANGAVFPYYCRLPSRDAIARASENTIGLIAALSIPWFAALVLFAGDITLLGSKWAPATGAVRFLAVYGLFLTLTLSALQVLKAVGRSDLVLLGRVLHLAVLAAVLVGTVSAGITVVALDQAVVACAIALVTCMWTVRYASVRPASLARSVGAPLLGVAGMILVVLVLGRLLPLGDVPSWTSLLVLGPLALAAFAGIMLVVMPELARKGWAALRGTAQLCRRCDPRRVIPAVHKRTTRAKASPPPPVVLVLPQLDRWAGQWDRLVDLSPMPTPFMRSWWLTGAGGPRCHFLLVVQDGTLLGGLALDEGRWLGLPCLRVMSGGPLCPDHVDLLAAPGDEITVARLAGAWLGRPGARLLDFAGIPAGARLSTVLPGRVRCEPVAAAPWAALPADAEVYLAARPTKFRKNLRQASARMRAAGVTYRMHRGASALRSLRDLRLLHQAQWGNGSRFLPSFARFAAACRLGAEFDEVAVHELTAGDTVVAIMVTFEVAGRLSLYQSARLTDFRWRDATAVLLAEIIADACSRGFAEVDFLRGEETYKANFAPERRELVRLLAASGRTGRTALAAGLAARKTRHATTRLADGHHRPSRQEQTFRRASGR